MNDTPEEYEESARRKREQISELEKTGGSTFLIDSLKRQAEEDEAKARRLRYGPVQNDNPVVRMARDNVAEMRGERSTGQRSKYMSDFEI